LSPINLTPSMPHTKQPTTTPLTASPSQYPNRLSSHCVFAIFCSIVLRPPTILFW
jgi:hypothetical protein